MKIGTVLRAVAIAIAIAGAIDPSIAGSRRDTPVVSVLATSTRDQALADRTARALERDFVIVRQRDAGAAAVVAAGDRVPDAVELGRTPAFAVLSADPVWIDQIDVPERASLDSRVPISFLAHARGETSVESRLRVNGLVVDRQTLTLKAPDDTIASRLTFVATTTGLARIQIEVAAADATASADGAIEVDQTRWKVLSFDARPSWASTFVRRSLEDDSRFVVTARVATSPRSSTAVGPAPAALAESLDGFDVIVIGAPDALTTTEVDRLEAFARRGGAICVLMDRLASGPYERLLGSSGWTGRQSAQPTAIESNSERLGRLQATELALPALRAGAETIASASGRPVVWRTPMGSGTVVASGALDAWRQRGGSGNDYTRFWRTLVGDAAAAARGSLVIDLGQRIFRPGAPMDVRVALGDTQDALTSTTQVRARVDGASYADPVRLWPERSGQFAGTRVAPSTPGVYRIVVDGSIASDPRRHASMQRAASFLVATNAADVSDRDLLEAWSSAHRGIAVKNEDFPALRAAIVRAVAPPARVTTMFPLRSIWWLVPFALTLTAEWWLRRRAGRP